MPVVTSGNTHAPTVMIGERAAELVADGARRPEPGDDPCLRSESSVRERPVCTSRSSSRRAGWSRRSTPNGPRTRCGAGGCPTPSSTTTARVRASARSAPTCGTRPLRRSRATGTRSRTSRSGSSSPATSAVPSLSVDYRIYQSRLLEVFEERGGKRRGRCGRASPTWDGSPERHDLLAVSTGRGGLIDLFPPIPDRSPFQQPARLLSAGLYRGIADAGEPRHVVLSLLGPLGEIINIPMESHDGIVEVVLFECVPGGDLETVALTPLRRRSEGARPARAGEAPYACAASLRAGRRGVVRARRSEQHPAGSDRPDRSRESYAKLDDGTYAIALGDAHVSMDPVVGLGANAASLSAFFLGEAIVEGGPFDEAFCQRVDERRLPGVMAHFDFTNFMLAPQPHLFQVIGAMTQSAELANEFTDNFTDPSRHLEYLATPEATAAYVAEFAPGER